MCIRDRPAIAIAIAIVAERAVGGKVGTQAGGKPVEFPDGPVSYTHLRAHETVLDLVCRLLLEKKKKTHTQ